MNKREKKFNQRQELILQTAEELIKGSNYHSIKMVDIANELDIAKGTLYLHFKSKEELVFNLVKPKMIDFLETVRTITKEAKGPYKQIEKIINEAFSSSFFQFVLSSFPDMSAIFHGVNGDELTAIQNDIIDCFAGIVNQGKKDQLFSEELPTEFAALHLMQLLDPLVYSILVHQKGMDHADFVQYTTRHYLRGIKK